MIGCEQYQLEEDKIVYFIPLTIDPTSAVKFFVCRAASPTRVRTMLTTTTSTTNASVAKIAAIIVSIIGTKRVENFGPNLMAAVCCKDGFKVKAPQRRKMTKVNAATV